MRMSEGRAEVLTSTPSATVSARSLNECLLPSARIFGAVVTIARNSSRSVGRTIRCARYSWFPAQFFSPIPGPPRLGPTVHGRLVVLSLGM